MDISIWILLFESEIDILVPNFFIYLQKLFDLKTEIWVFNYKSRIYILILKIIDSVLKGFYTTIIHHKSLLYE